MVLPGVQKKNSIHTMKVTLNLAAFLLVALFPLGLSAQKIFTRDAKAYFDATAKSSPERIEATNNSGTLVLEQSSGRIEAAVLIKGFLFEKALMQEHFNENYLESGKFPKASFKGKIDDLSKVNFTRDGSYSVPVSGDLTLHGVTKPIKTAVTFNIKNGKVSAATSFPAILSEYGIAIPSLVADKVAKEATISVSGELKPMN